MCRWIFEPFLKGNFPSAILPAFRFAAVQIATKIGWIHKLDADLQKSYDKQNKMSQINGRNLAIDHRKRNDSSW